MFGEGLKRRREMLGLSQVQLSEKCGVPQSTISAVESGVRIPKEDTMAMIAAGLDCTVGDLLGENDSSPSQDADGLDERIKKLTANLSEEDYQRVEDFVQGLKAARKAPASRE